MTKIHNLHVSILRTNVAQSKTFSHSVNLLIPCYMLLVVLAVSIRIKKSRGSDPRSVTYADMRAWHREEHGYACKY
jgi:hypothetical protein